MSKELVVSTNPHETRVAILEDGQLCEIYVEREKEFALVGSIYKGRVTRVLPGMQSAFVEIGLDSDAFLYVSDFLEGLEEYESVVAPVESKLQRMEEEGGGVFAPPAPAGGTAEAAPEPIQAEAPAISQPPPAAGFNTRTQTSYENRGSAPRGYGRDDRRGGRGGRGGGGGGRWRRGRGGRSLPPSKFVSHRPYEPPEESSPSTESAPVILPGESLAKYKDRLPTASPAEATSTGAEVLATIPETQVSAIPTEPSAPFATTAPEEPHGTPSAGTTEAEVPEPEPEPMVPEEHEAEETNIGAMEAEVSARGSADAQSAEPELTADELSALREQVAEAQMEEAAAAAEAARISEEEGETNGLQEAFVEPEGEGHAEGHELHGMTEPTPEGEGQTAVEAGEASEPATTPIIEPGNALEPDRTASTRSHWRPRMQQPHRRDDRGRRPRGRFRDRRPHAPRRPQLISELLKQGQEIIVQIAKEPLGKKGARITSHVALPGRFLVYMPTLDHIGVSRKIGSADQRSRLRRLVTEAKANYPGGFIVRTAAAGATDEEIRSDVEFLAKAWQEIRERAEQRKAPALLHRDLNLVERILRDYLSGDFASIWVDNEEEYTKVVEFVSRFQPALASRVKLYTKEAPIFEEFGIQQEIDKALRPKVWLKSGGYIVINHTEALVAIDVNTGKYVGRGSTRLEDTIVRTNLEAVKEVVRQIRLRDLGGIIVVDFIDMEERRNREKVMKALEEALRTDRAPSKVLPFNEFGLVAITRKRTKQALERTLCQPCPYCSGSGMVKSLPTICYEIQTEARKMAPELDSASLTLRVNPEIAKALKTRESGLVEELERWTKKSVIIQADATLHWEQYDIY